MAVELKENEIYPITDGNGGVRFARIIDGTLKPYRLDYEWRPRRGGKAKFKGPINLSRRAFHKLISEAPAQ